MFDPRDAWDPLHDPGSAEAHWSTDNVGEAAPGVLTPLSWSFWGTVGDSMPREIAYAMGVFSRAERAEPAAAADRIVLPFYGRIAMQMQYLATVGDRLPGITGEDAVRGLFGRVPEDMAFHPTRRRYPVVAWRLPIAALATPGRVRRLGVQTDAWWRAQVPRLGDLSLPAAIALFDEGYRRFDHTITIHSLGLLAVVQPLYEALAKLVDRTGVGDVGLLSGSGGAEMAIIGDMWKASRGHMDLDQVVRNHGFHGPREGEISSRVWREDATPLARLIKEYAARDESEDPIHREEAARRRRPEVQRLLIAAVPRHQRPGVLALLKLAAVRLPLRGVGKRSFLQSLDIARGAARRAGECLAAAGTLDDPGDVFYLLRGELTGPLPPGVTELVAQRRARRAEYEAVSIPGSWKGTPVPVHDDEGAGPADRGDAAVVTGIGVSAGVAEGIVRVVTDPGFADVEPGEVLVTPTTDPSWASIMFVSCALVVDIGGALSHAAVVARELDIPCVVNTRSGTRALRTGDRVRVDGSRGTVEILRRA